MTTTKVYIKEWQQALQKEINHLKKFGGNRFVVSNGRQLSTENPYPYYFDTSMPLGIPVGSTVKLEWGGMTTNGRVLSSEGNGIILGLDDSLGDLISEAFLFHDPWELLQQLIDRFDEMKKSKRKLARVKRLMNPTMETKHPVEKIKGNIHELVLRSKYNPVTFVWGPPGTGKTYTLARVAAHKYFKEKRVLVLSHSNQAVDVLITEITSFVKRKNRFKVGDILRYGAITGERLSNENGITTSQLIEKQDPLLADDRNKLFEERRLLKQDLARSFSTRDSKDLLDLESKIAKVLAKVRQKELQFLKEAYIVGTTLAKAAIDPAVFEQEFDLVILDEASMAYVPQAALAASLGKRLIICGDFKQLPPIASSRDPLVEKWMKEDIFHRTSVVDSLNPDRLHPHLFMLKEQRRMHPGISSFTNQYIYQNLVGDHESVRKSRNKIVDKAPFPGRASVLVDTSFSGMYCINDKRSNSRFNLWQLLLSFQLIHEAYSTGAMSIGYVTPYRAQANLMNILLEDIYKVEKMAGDIIAATVHKFQGSERDVMIFDTVDSEPQQRAGMLLTGKNSERLINVAITRTKGKFLHISNLEFIRQNIYRGKTLRQLVEHQVKHQQRITNQDVGSWIQHQHPDLQWIYARKLEPVFHDIEIARTSITISLPSAMTLSEEWNAALLNRRNGVKLTIISEERWSDLQATQWIEKNFPYPFVIIDTQIIWLGLPLEGVRGIQPPYIAARLNSRMICEQMLGQC
ncbi:AAA domain-containing protein [Niallia sp. Krafla_26]|uniref:AAA domain-containing protein n=1 Tax=Niallia sp. Krafla_26 TaxID=3064703 RepID=UPI003D1753B2